MRRTFFGLTAGAAVAAAIGCSSSPSETASSQGGGAGGSQGSSGGGSSSSGKTSTTSGGQGGQGGAGQGGAGGGADDDGPFAAKRAACAFHAGDLPSHTFGASIASRALPIDTIVIVSQENRSFDSYFGKLPSYGQPDVDAFDPNVQLKDDNGHPHSPFHQTDYCSIDPRHKWDPMHDDWNHGANDKFVSENGADGKNTLGYFNHSDLTFYYELANIYGVGDKYFAALLGPTKPNRMYLYAATSAGHISDDIDVDPTMPNIFKELAVAGVSFGVYSGGPDSKNCVGKQSFETKFFCNDIPGGAKSLQACATDAAADKLPKVVWIYAGDTEHPSDDMQVGEKDVQGVFDTLAGSPAWQHAVFLLTDDEGGGFYDHVPPPPACEPDSIQPNIPAEGTVAGKFDIYGFRVPFVVASPYSKPHFVSHVVNSHTTILRFIEIVNKLPAISDRDANAESFFEFFDFTHPSFATPAVPAPVVVAPASSVGCP